MGMGFSIFLTALGAVMRYAITTNTQGVFNIHTGGVILMIVGLVGLVISMLFWSSFAPFGNGRSASNTLHEEVITHNGQERGRIVRETHDHTA